MVRKCLYYAWLTIASSVILVALLFNSVRLLTLLLNQHHHWLETHISQWLDQPLHFSQVKITWHGWNPAMEFHDLTIQEEKTHSPLQVAQASIVFQLFSGWHYHSWRPTKIYLSGLSLTAFEEKTGGFTVPALQPYWQSDSNAAIHFFIKDALIKMVLSNDETVLVHHANLKWWQNQRSAIISGSGSISNSEQDFHFVYVSDNFLQQKKLYLSLNQFLLPQWQKLIFVKKYLPANFSVQAGQFSAKFWLDWLNNDLKTIQGSVVAENLIFKVNKKTHSLTKIQTNFSLQKFAEKGWRLEGNNLNITFSPRHVWHKGKLVLLWNKGGVDWLYGRINHLNIKNVLPYLDIFSSQLQRKIVEQKLDGRLNKISFFVSDKDFVFKTHFQDLTTILVPSSLALSKINGGAVIGNNQGLLQLNKTPLIFTPTEVGSNNDPLQLSRVSASVNWRL